MSTARTKVPKLDMTKTGMKSYLTAHPRRKFMIQDWQKCPVAKYINNQLPKGLYADVTTELIEIYSTKKTDKKLDGSYVLKSWTPSKWMQEFMDAFDSMTLQGTEVMSVTGQRVLEELF